MPDDVRPPEAGRTPPPDDEADDGLDLGAYLAIIRRRRRWVAGPIVGCLVLAVLYALLTQPVYAPEASLLIQDTSQRPLLSMALSTLPLPVGMLPRTGVNTEAELLQSLTIRCLATQFMASQGDLVRQLTTGRKMVGTYRDLPPNVLDIRPDPRAYLALESSQAPSVAILGALQIDNVRDTSIIRIRAASTDKQLAADVANAVCLAYLTIKWQDSQADVNASLKVLTEEVGRARNTLEQAEDALSRYQTARLPTEEEVGSTQEADQLYSALRDLRGQKTTLESSLASQRGRLAELRNQLSKQTREVTSTTQITTSPVVTQLQAQLATLYGQRFSLLMQLTPEAADVRDLDARIEEVKKQIGNEIQMVEAGRTRIINPTYQQLMNTISITEAEVLAAQAMVAPVKRELDRVRAKLSRLPQNLRALGDLQQELEAAKTRYITLRQGQEQLQLQQDTTAASARIITPARATDQLQRIKPRRVAAVCGGMFLGALLGLLLAVFVEKASGVYLDSRDLEQDLGLPLLGILPSVPPPTKPLVTEGGAPRGWRTGIDSLRIQLQIAAQRAPRRVLLITSSAQGEGKATIGANLALSMAQAGHRTVLIDANLSQPKIDSLLGLEPGPGLTRLLAGEADWESCLHRLPEDGERPVDCLEVLPAGSSVENPLALLASEAFGHLVQELAQRADFVLIVAPAVGPCSEVWALAAQASAVLMVVDLSKARRKAVRNAVRLLTTARVEPLGLVGNRVNDVDRSGSRGAGI